MKGKECNRYILKKLILLTKQELVGGDADRIG